MKPYISFTLLTTLLSGHALATTFKLADALEMAKAHNGQLQATELLTESAVAAQAKGDLELSPYLLAKVGRMDDRKPTLQPAFQGDRTEAKQLSLGVAKKFATGTSAQITLLDNWAQISGTAMPMPVYWTPSLTLSVSQSLWKDFFGRQSRLRRTRESETTELQKLAQLLTAKQTLLTVEHSYWDHVYAVVDLKLKKESLTRAEKLVVWMNKRVTNGLSDRSDLLQVRGLEMSRRLQWVSAEDERLASLKKLETVVGATLADHDIEDDIEQPRALDLGPQDIRLDAVLSRREAALKSDVAREINEAMNPELNVMGSIGTNSQKDSFSSSMGGFTDTSKNTWMLGIEFKMDLDPNGKSSFRKSAELEAQAAEHKKNYTLQDSQTSKEELLRRDRELGNRIDTARQLIVIQKEKATRERDRLERGRTITFQVINFEQEQSEAEGLLIKLFTERRKLEATRQLFVSANFGD